MIELGDIVIAMSQKEIKHVHLSVHPPLGRVTLVAPTGTRQEVARAYAISKIGWIRDRRAKLQSQARETPRQFIKRESHYLWGRRYLLCVGEEDAKPSVELSHREITLTVRPGSSTPKRERVMHDWHKALLHEAVPALIAKWQAKLGVTVSGYFLQRMKTKWGSCNHRAGNIRLNTELVKKPKDLLEYVVGHEMMHLIEPTHSELFIALLDEHYPSWRKRAPSSMLYRSLLDLERIEMVMRKSAREAGGADDRPGHAASDQQLVLGGTGAAACRVDVRKEEGARGHPCQQSAVLNHCAPTWRQGHLSVSAAIAAVGSFALLGDSIAIAGGAH